MLDPKIALPLRFARHLSQRRACVLLEYPSWCSMLAGHQPIERRSVAGRKSQGAGAANLRAFRPFILPDANYL